ELLYESKEVTNMKRILTIVVFFIVMFIIPTHAFAVDYSIENMQIHAFLQENGDVHVTEEQTYQFDEKFNGITRTLIPKKNTTITDVEATEQDKSLEVEQEDDLYKIHRSGKDETATIQLSYTIED